MLKRAKGAYEIRAFNDLMCSNEHNSCLNEHAWLENLSLVFLLVLESYVVWTARVIHMSCYIITMCLVMSVFRDFSYKYIMIPPFIKLYYCDLQLYCDLFLYSINLHLSIKSIWGGHNLHYKFVINFIFLIKASTIDIG